MYCSVDIFWTKTETQNTICILLILRHLPLKQNQQQNNLILLEFFITDFSILKKNITTHIWQCNVTCLDSKGDNKDFDLVSF